VSEFVPHAYQERVIERMLRQERLGLLLDPGLGKTPTTLEAFRRLHAVCEAARLLVVAPLRPAYTVWPEEARKWAQFRHLKVHVLHGKGKTEAALEEGVADVYVINSEGLGWLALQRWRWPDMLAVDESTKFKRLSAQRSRLLRQTLRHVPRRHIRTGTPAPNGIEDLHGQINILDDGLALGRKMKDFREKFCAPVPVGDNRWEWVVRESQIPEIYRRIEPLVVRLDARDYLELPEKVVTEVVVDLPSKARALYDTLREELVIELNEGSVVALNAGSLTAKCRQVANGTVYLSDDGEVSSRSERRSAQIHAEKTNALSELVEELGGKPVLVAYEFQHELPAIKQALRGIVGGEVPHLGGGVSAARGVELERAWNAGRLRVLLVHPQSAAHGLNLQAGGAHIIWYSLPWDLELYDQLNGRLWRQGQQAERVFIYHLVARRTIDGIVSRALRRKAASQDALCQALRGPDE